MAELKKGWWSQVKTAVKRYRYWIGVEASIVLGLIFLAAGAAKLLHQPGAFEVFFIPYPDFISRIFTKFYFIWLPRVEVLLGLLLVFGVAARLVAVIASVFIASFITSNVLMIIRDLNQCLSCFGPRVQLSSLNALIIDLIMVVLVVIVLLCYQRRFYDINPWFVRRGRSGKKEDRSGSG